MKQIAIAPAQYRDYHTAAQRLARIMGPLAPSAETLIRHELSHRRPQLIIDEYLDGIGWNKVRRQVRPRLIASAKRGPLRPTSLQFDLSRN